MVVSGKLQDNRRTNSLRVSIKKGSTLSAKSSAIDIPDDREFLKRAFSPLQ